MQVFISRIVAAWVAGLASWLLVKFGIGISVEDQANVVEHLVGIIIPVGMTCYAIVHKLLSKRTNPGDAASSTLAASEASETSVLKARKDFTARSV